MPSIAIEALAYNAKHCSLQVWCAVVIIVSYIEWRERNERAWRMWNFTAAVLMQREWVYYDSCWHLLTNLS